jgi:hypothetical protein
MPGGTGKGARISDEQTRIPSPGELFMEDGCFEPYRWRDPARLSCERLAELAEQDRASSRQDKELLGAAVRRGQAAKRAARQAEAS